MNNILKNKLVKILTYCFAIITSLIILFNVKFLREILYIILLSFILSYTLKPLYKLLVKRDINNKAAAFMMIVGLILGILIIFIILIPSIIKESLSLGKSLDELQKYISNFYYKLNVIKSNKMIGNAFNTIYVKINKGLVKLFDNLLNTTASLGENILQIIIIPIITYYFLCDSEYIEDRLLILFPMQSRKIIKRINVDIDRVLGRYIVSQFILCILVSIFTFIPLILLKVKFPLILSILNGILNIIPYFGPIFGMIPPVIIALLTSTKTALYTAIWLYSVQLIEGNIISPKITGESVSMHPLTVIILLLIGGEVGGFLGMVLAVPIGVIFKVIYNNLNYYLF